MVGRPDLAASLTAGRHASTPTRTHRRRAPSAHHMTHDVSEAKRINRSTIATLVHTSPYILSHTMLRSPRIMSRASPLLSSVFLQTDRPLHLTACGSANRWVCVEPSGWTTGTTGDSCGLVSTLGSVHDRSTCLLRLGALFTLGPRRPTVSTQLLANNSRPSQSKRRHRWMVIRM